MLSTCQARFELDRPTRLTSRPVLAQAGSAPTTRTAVRVLKTALARYYRLCASLPAALRARAGRATWAGGHVHLVELLPSHLAPSHSPRRVRRPSPARVPGGPSVEKCEQRASPGSWASQRERARPSGASRATRRASFSSCSRSAGSQHSSRAARHGASRPTRGSCTALPCATRRPPTVREHFCVIRRCSHGARARGRGDFARAVRPRVAIQ